ncbi:MAG: glyoxylate/hydroxypyruvate reductase A [Litoreibacter sp.]
MINVLFSASDSAWEKYETPLSRSFSEQSLEVKIFFGQYDPAAIDYIVYAPDSGLEDFTPFTRLKAVMNLWAGVEDVVGNQTLDVPLCRMVGGGLTEGMVEWVTAHVLRYHLEIDRFLDGQDGVWRNDGWAPPLACDRKVTILGLGALGAACGSTLAGLGFQVHGWSRSQKQIKGLTCHHGEDGLTTALAEGEIVVLLLPLTPATENILNDERLAMLQKGAVVINPGRGPLIDDDALLAGLDSGQISHATLDVFRVEPLPKDHAYWAHPQVTVTPHIASATRPLQASRVIAANIARNEAGQPFLNVVDRQAGY